ncbi:MAG TPA: MATE family efflux transporter, partial [Polyangiaceae bacterium]|nr:MATE family efflux transporter [Polyangiaceae bacterium]
YARVRLLGAPFFLVACAMREAQNGMGDARTAMRAAIAANIVNIALDSLFILHLGFGVPGAAAAAVLANGVEVAWLARAQRAIGFGLSALRSPSHRATVVRLWRLGVPIGLQFLLEVGSFATLTAIFASMGELDLAAHQIALQLCHFSFMPMVALGEAASILVGQAIGARASGLVKRVARMAVYVTLAYGVLCGLVFAILGHVLASAFTKEAPLVALAAKLLYVAAAFQLFDGANIVARSVLRGTGDVRFAALVGVICAWVCTPPLALALGYGAGLGALGGWLGLCIEIIAGTAILWWRLERGYWVVSARSLRRAEAALHAA